MLTLTASHGGEGECQPDLKKRRGGEGEAVGHPACPEGCSLTSPCPGLFRKSPPSVGPVVYQGWFGHVCHCLTRAGALPLLEEAVGFLGFRGAGAFPTEGGCSRPPQCAVAVGCCPPWGGWGPAVLSLTEMPSGGVFFIQESFVLQHVAALCEWMFIIDVLVFYGTFTFEFGAISTDTFLVLLKASRAPKSYKGESGVSSTAHIHSHAEGLAMA